MQLGGAQCHTAPGSARRRLRLFFLGGIPGCISRARTRGNATCLVYLLEVLELGTGVDLMVVGVVPAMEGNGGANGEGARNGRTMIIQWNPNLRAAGAGRRVWHLTGWDEGRDLTLSPAAAVTGPGGTTNQRDARGPRPHMCAGRVRGRGGAAQQSQAACPPRPDNVSEHHADNRVQDNDVIRTTSSGRSRAGSAWPSPPAMLAVRFAKRMPAGAPRSAATPRAFRRSP